MSFEKGKIKFSCYDNSIITSPCIPIHNVDKLESELTSFTKQFSLLDIKTNNIIFGEKNEHNQMIAYLKGLDVENKELKEKIEELYSIIYKILDKEKMTWD